MWLFSVAIESFIVFYFEILSEKQSFYHDRRIETIANVAQKKNSEVNFEQVTERVRTSRVTTRVIVFVWNKSNQSGWVNFNENNDNKLCGMLFAIRANALRI